MKFLSVIFLSGLMFFSYSCHLKSTKPPNILFIAVDDLRPELNCFGSHHIKSPNIDKVAHSGIIFQQAYCQVPVCGASRASLLTGLRPGYTWFIDYDTWADKDAPGALTLPQHFKNNGYYTLSNGKIFHHREDKLQSWSEDPWLPVDDVEGPKYWRDYQLKDNIRILTSLEGNGPAFEKADVEDNAYFDGRLAEKCIRDLRRLKEMDQPFFLAAGFYKPHLPFNAPSKYWNLYKQEDIRLADNPFRPKHAPDASMHNFGELRNYTNIPNEGPLPDSLARLLVHGYYACVSYTDTQIGKVLNELKNLGLDDNTIVIIWGDHGWNLGEHGLWCKHCNYETSLRAPIILQVPWLEGGLETDALVEFIDIYPTLCDLAGLEIPPHLQGESLRKYFNDPALPGKPYVFSRFIRGESVKNADYRYTEWLNPESSRYADMLYDHHNDPEENHNIAAEEPYTDIIELFREMNVDNRKKAEEVLQGISNR